MGASPKKYYQILKQAIKNSYYTSKVNKGKLLKKTVFMESKSGGDLAGNIFYLIKELSSPDYSNFEIYLVVMREKMSSIGNLLNHYGIQKVHFILPKSRSYYRLLATAEFLVNDTTFPSWFIKRDDQHYLNTWHGTPFKLMGRNVENRAYAIGNAQANFINADYLLYPNEYMKDVMFKAYMLDGIYQGEVVYEGYPRNSKFYDRLGAEKLRKELQWEGKQISIYMPTWRGTLTDKKSTLQEEAASCYFDILDGMLSDNQIFYVKFHVFAAKAFSFADYKHIRPFPQGYETYDLLNAADILVTDYSSVFFDFANSGKKIILFTYDGEEYLDQRGLYIPIESIPFPCVTTSEELAAELKRGKNYDDTEFRKIYCMYDHAEATQNLAKHVFKGEDCCKVIDYGAKQVQNPDQKERVLVYASNLGRNGITTSLMNLINLADKTSTDYYFTFHQERMRKTPLRLNDLPKEVKIMPISGEIENWTLTEAFAYAVYFKLGKDYKWAYQKVCGMFDREYKKRFGRVPFTQMIQFTGYSPDITMLFMSSKAKKAIFVHSDIFDEIMEKGNQHLPTIKHAYSEYDKVVAASSAVKESLLKISKDQSNVVVLENAHYNKGVLEKAKLELKIDPETKMTVTEEELKTVLASDRLKFITIGRYSEEKGHMKLIAAFARFHEAHPEAMLIIIGGYGKLYRKTVEAANATNCAEDIIFIRAISNPFPILKRCDLFLLPSDREALGLVLLEADTLGIPIVATDIPGSGDFLRTHGGYLVPNSEDGLEKGMEAFVNGKVKPMNVSFDEYNNDIIKRFETLLTGGKS